MVCNIALDIQLNFGYMLFPNTGLNFCSNVPYGDQLTPCYVQYIMFQHHVYYITCATNMAAP